MLGNKIHLTHPILCDFMDMRSSDSMLVILPSSQKALLFRAFYFQSTFAIQFKIFKMLNFSQVRLIGSSGNSKKRIAKEKTKKQYF